MKRFKPIDCPDFEFFYAEKMNTTIAKEIINGVCAIFDGEDKQVINKEIIKNAQILATEQRRCEDKSEIYQFSDKSSLQFINDEIYEKY